MKRVVVAALSAAGILLSAPTFALKDYPQDHNLPPCKKGVVGTNCSLNAKKGGSSATLSVAVDKVVRASVGMGYFLSGNNGVFSCQIRDAELLPVASNALFIKVRVVSNGKPHPGGPQACVGDVAVAIEDYKQWREETRHSHTFDNAIRSLFRQ